MEIDEKLLGQVSDFLNTSEGAELLSELKSSLGFDKEKPSENSDNILSQFMGSGTKSSFDNIDIAKLIPLITAISSAKTDNRATNLLVALKPLLSGDRQGKIDHAISIMKILALLPILEEHGFSIKELFN